MSTQPRPATLSLRVDGRPVEVPDDGASLLEVLRDRLGLRSAKDGCSPQGQCGCCTVLVDGAPRVACVTPARRVADRDITTLDGLDEGVRRAWADVLTAGGASQCGFCTPGIIVRLSALEHRDRTSVEQALLAHLCRCTGWRTIVDAAVEGMAGAPSSSGVGRRRRDLGAAAVRARLEGGEPQAVGPDVTLGAAGFADDSAPLDALVAVPDGAGGWAVGETLTEARRVAGKVPGRRTTLAPGHPLDVPEGRWARTLRTTWVEPAYLEPDASWCVPGGVPVTPLANGGAFGGKATSAAPSAARALADHHGRAVRVVYSREDVVRLGPKRPPVAGGVRADGSGVLRAVRTAGLAAAVAAVAPAITVEEIDVAGPPTSLDLRGAGWAEAAILLASLTTDPRLVAPGGGWAEATMARDGSLDVVVGAGDPLDEVVLRSYCTGATHMALGWVRSEGLAVDAEGTIHDLTIRSFGILRAHDMPDVRIVVDPAGGAPVAVSAAVFAAVATAAWRADGFAQDWPTTRGRRP